MEELFLIERMITWSLLTHITVPLSSLIFGHRTLCCKLPKIQTNKLNNRTFCPKGVNWIAYSEDPDQTAPLGAVWSGSALFAQTHLSENFGSLWVYELHHETFCICKNTGVDQRLYFHFIDTCSPIPLLLKIWNFKSLAIFCGCTARFESDLV